jgi:hypothetical protein
VINATWAAPLLHLLEGFARRFAVLLACGQLEWHIGIAAESSFDGGEPKMTSLKQTLRVLAGHRVEIVAPELIEGDVVDVVVTPRTNQPKPRMSLVAFLDSLPDGPRAFASWEEYEQFLREEKEAWDR